MSEQNLKKNNINVRVKREANCIVELNIDLDKQQCQAIHQKAAKKVAKQISLPGFRKGHAPEAMIKEKFSGQLEKQYREDLIQTAFIEGIRIANIYPRKQEAIQKAKIEKLTENEACVYFLFESDPELPKIELSQIELDQQAGPIEITNEEIQEVIKSIQNAHPIYEDSDRTVAEKGDIIRLSASQPNENDPVIIFKDRIFNLDDGIPQWLLDATIGMEVGQSKDVVPKEETLPITITLNKILFSKSPEVDDALAKKVGAKSVEDMQEKIASVLTKKKEERIKEEQLNELRKKLVNFYPLDLPRGLIEEEKEARIARKEQSLADTEEENRESKLEEFKKDLEEKVINDLTLYFLLAAISKLNLISLTKAEISHLYANETQYHQNLYGMGKESELLKKRLHQAESIAMQKKIEEFALSEVLKGK